LAWTGRTLAPFGGRRCGDNGEIDGVDGSAWYLVTDVVFDVGKRDRVFLAAEADGIALSAGARGAADAMHIIFGIVRQIEIEHVTDVGNVQAA
jgi:hypothetical protein